jgi:hypothetical protein
VHVSLENVLDNQIGKKTWSSLIYLHPAQLALIQLIDQRSYFLLNSLSLNVDHDYLFLLYFPVDERRIVLEIVAPLEQ